MKLIVPQLQKIAKIKKILGSRNFSRNCIMDRELFSLIIIKTSE